MDYAFVLEDDQLYRKQIENALKEINPLLGLKYYANLEEFYNWMKEIIAQGTAAWAEEEKDTSRVRLIVLRGEFLGVEKLDLLNKVKELFVRKGMCTDEEPVAFVLTAFEDPGFQIEKYQKPFVFNVIFKPFDELILREHLSYALAGRLAPSEFSLSYQEANTEVEMLKNVEIESLSDIGFTSRSHKPFEVGYISKYYGESFVGENLNSVFARLARCLPHPENPKEYELEFHFFSNEPSQISNIRKRVRSLRGRGSVNERALPSTKGNDAPIFVIIEPRDQEFESIAGTLRRKIKNGTVARYATAKMFEEDLQSPHKAKGVLGANVFMVELTREFTVSACEPADSMIWGEPLRAANLAKYINPIELKDLGIWAMGTQKQFIVQTQYAGHLGALRFERNGKRISIFELEPLERITFFRSKRKVKSSVAALFINGRDIDPKNLNNWENLRNVMQAELDHLPPAYVIAEKPYKEQQKKELAKYFDDIFISPVDRGYFLQKLVFRVPGLRIADEAVTVSERRVNEQIKAVSPVFVEKLSEAAMTMKYHRPMSPGGYAEFILWQPYILGAPQILGTCYESEKLDGKEIEYKIHFVLFGMRDQLLKSIRLWIRESYVQLKERASG